MRFFVLCFVFAKFQSGFGSHSSTSSIPLNFEENSLYSPFEYINSADGSPVIIEIEPSLEIPYTLSSICNTTTTNGTLISNTESISPSLMKLTNIKTEPTLNRLKNYGHVNFDGFRMIGFQNGLSNSYMNASLQVLLHMIPLLTRLKGELKDINGETVPLIQFFHLIATELTESPLKYLKVSQPVIY